MNRDRVVLEARKLFEKRGVSVEMDEIARRAGVGVGTIYRHFPTKESLIQAVAESTIDRLLAAARARADAEDPGAAFYDFLGVLAEEFATKQSLSHAIAPATQAPARAAVAALREAFGHAVAELLERAKRAGAVRDDVTPTDVMLLMKSTLAPREPDEDVGAARKRMFAIVCAGLRPAPRPAPH